MSINVFFLSVLAVLLGMYGYFVPEYSENAGGGEIPKIHLFSFSIYEVSVRGVDHILEGEEGKKFDDRYEITSAKFSDNTKSQLQTLSAARAHYENDILDLAGAVRYRRADGLEFRSEEGRYDSKGSLVTTKGAFTITQQGNRVDGTRLHYNTERDTVSADAVRGSYQLD